MFRTFSSHFRTVSSHLRTVFSHLRTVSSATRRLELCLKTVSSHFPKGPISGNINITIHEPVDRFARVESSVLDLGLADVQVGDDVAVNSHVLTDHIPEKENDNNRM